MAGLIERSTIEEIIEKADILSVVSNHVRLKKAGANYKGRCPFHQEADPSFTVSPEKGIFHCFGCGEGGDVIRFVMLSENLSFSDAVQLLADRYGVEVKQSGKSVNRAQVDEKKRLLSLNKDAANWFYFQKKESETAKAYIVKRGLSKEAVKSFGIGYAPAGWRNLITAMRKMGYSEEELLKAGLISQKDTSVYDKFRDRLIFPIQDVSGRVIAFGGRALREEDNPKYLNSPETAVYIKGRHIYNLNRAKVDCKEHLILVEGYMDAVSLVSAGIENTVAALGTALTPTQAKLLGRYTARVYLAYDSDRAGRAAAVKNALLLDGLEIEARILSLPKEKDPDDYVRKYGREAFLALLETAKDAYIYQFDALKEEYGGIDTREKRVAYANRAIQLLRGLDNAVRLEGYVEYVAAAAKISKTVIREQLARGGTAIVEMSAVKEEKKLPQKKRGSILAQEKLLLILAQSSENYIKYGDFIRILEFEEGILKDTLNNIIESHDCKASFSPASYIAQMNNEADRNYIAGVFAGEVDDVESVQGYIDIVMVDNLNRRIEKAKENYAAALEEGDLNAANENLNLVKALTKSIQSVKNRGV